VRTGMFIGIAVALLAVSLPIEAQTTGGPGTAAGVRAAPNGTPGRARINTVRNLISSQGVGTDQSVETKRFPLSFLLASTAAPGSDNGQLSDTACSLLSLTHSIQG